MSSTSTTSVTLTWTEETEHTSVIEVDLDEIVAWLNDGIAEDAPHRSTHETVTPGVIQAFLTSGRDEHKDWIDAAVANTRTSQTEHPSLLNVKMVD